MKLNAIFTSAYAAIALLFGVVEAQDSAPYMGAVTAEATARAAGDDVLAAAMVAQADTNDATSTTTYTPRYIGDKLLGKVDSSNAVWIARGLTTNDWSLVDGNGGDFGADDLAADSVGASELIEGEVYTVAGLTTTGALTIAEGMITDSKIVSADIKDDTLVNADINSAAAIVATKISGTAVTYVTASQLSGDTTTDPTTNTPAFRGQVLIGGAGEGMNGVWIAKGTTTNDWVQLSVP